MPRIYKFLSIIVYQVHLVSALRLTIPLNESIYGVSFRRTNMTDNRISGGYMSKTFPGFFVSLRSTHYLEYFGDNHFCGGSLIKTNVVLTAAHCFFVESMRRELQPKDIVVVAGAKRRLSKKGTQQRDAMSLIYPQEHKDSMLYDIGLIILKKEFDFNNNRLRTIDLPTKPVVLGERCISMGFGKLFFVGVCWFCCFEFLL